MSLTHLLILAFSIAFFFPSVSFAGSLIDNTVSAIPSDLTPWAATGGIALAEYAIGKSKKLIPNSTIDLVIQIGMFLFKKFILKK